MYLYLFENFAQIVLLVKDIPNLSIMVLSIFCYVVFIMLIQNCVGYNSRIIFLLFDEMHNDSSCFILFLDISYNLPKFRPNATWNTTGEIFTKESNGNSFPRGIFVDTNNYVYVSYVEATQRVSVWSNSSITPTKSITDNINEPHSLFVTSNGDIYIDNGNRSSIIRWTVNDTSYSIAMGGYQDPCFGLFVDINDTIYCSIDKRHIVIKQSLQYNNSNWTAAAGDGSAGSDSNQLRFPHGIFVDVNFTLYVADCRNDRIQYFNFGVQTGAAIPINTALNRPTGVILDGDSNIYIVDNENNRIVMVTRNFSDFRCLLGCPGSPLDLNHPIGISFDIIGNIYVSDTKNKRIMKFFLSKSYGKCVDST